MANILSFLFLLFLAFISLPNIHLAGMELFLALCNVPFILMYLGKEFTRS